jgi:hypothetical protein
MMVSMRTGAAAGHTGYFHEAALYRSEGEFAAIVVPFLLGGVAAGEPTMVAFGDEHADLIHAALDRQEPGAAAKIIFLTGGDMYARPASAVNAYRAMLADHVAAGAAQIRIVGELAPAAFGATWDWWARYESAINHAYNEFPLWNMCAYDTTATPLHVLADVARTHPHIAAPDGAHLTNDHFIEPAVYLTEPRPAAIAALQHQPATVTFTDPSPANVRHAITDHAPTAVAGPELDGFLVAASEVVANAIRHGQPPVAARLWAGTDRMILSVTDSGTGPRDPYAGLLPRRDGAPGGLGLWLTAQMCDYVTFGRDGDRFTITLTVGNTDT